MMSVCVYFKILIKERPERMSPSRGEGGGLVKRHPFVKFFKNPLHFASPAGREWSHRGGKMSYILWMLSNKNRKSRIFLKIFMEALFLVTLSETLSLKL